MGHLCPQHFPDYNILVRQRIPAAGPMGAILESGVCSNGSDLYWHIDACHYNFVPALQQLLWAEFRGGPDAKVIRGGSLGVQVAQNGARSVQAGLICQIDGSGRLADSPLDTIERDDSHNADSLISCRIIFGTASHYLKTKIAGKHF